MDVESVLTEQEIYCPYCGEQIVVLVDPGDAGSTYVEDCQVCCRPIVLAPVSEPSGELTLHVKHEDD
ncbi:MAG: CPXCG motif-containing cysteine-rich protein [Halieaceae bacterium]